jgi:hypothetical protein
MAAGKPIIFDTLTITDAGGTSNPQTYQFMPVDGRELGIETEDTTVDAGDLYVNKFLNNLNLLTYDNDIASDTRCQVNTVTVPATRARLVLSGPSGSATATYDNVRPIVTTDTSTGTVGFRVRATAHGVTNRLVMS